MTMKHYPQPHEYSEAQQKVCRALNDLVEGLNEHAQEECQRGQPHEVWWLMSKSHQIHGLRRQLEMRGYL